MLQDFRTYIEQCPVSLDDAVIQNMLLCLRPKPAYEESVTNIFPLTPSDMIAIDGMIIAYLDYGVTDDDGNVRTAGYYHEKAGGLRPVPGERYAGHEPVIRTGTGLIPTTQSRLVIRYFIDMLKDEDGNRRADLPPVRLNDTDVRCLKR